jgi:hypothetical protein
VLARLDPTSKDRSDCCDVPTELERDAASVNVQSQPALMPLPRRDESATAPRAPQPPAFLSGGGRVRRQNGPSCGIRRWYSRADPP